MRHRTCETAAPRLTWTATRTVFAASTAAALLLAGASEAKELKLPTDKPLVVMDVPADWSVETTAVGTELRAPEKNAIVVAKVIEKQKPLVEAFAKSAAETLKAFGVAFAADAKPPSKPTAAKPAAANPATAKPAAPADKAAPAGGASGESLSAFERKPENFTFSGSPSLALPGTATSNDPQKSVPNSLEDLTGFGAPVAKTPKLPLRAAQYFGTSMNGKPVDVQLVLFSLPDNHYLAMMQESGSDDGRTVAMAQSVKRAK